MSYSWRELLLGFPYFKHKALINESKLWSKKEVLDYNNKIISKYSSFPISTKENYIHSPQLYENKWLRPLAREITTGGTTGSPFKFKRDYIYSSQKERAYIFDIWKDIGYSPYELRVLYRGNVSKSSKLLTYNKLENCYIIDPRLLNSRTKESLYQTLLKLPPFYFHVYPSTLLSFINLIGESRFKKLPIIGVHASSEVFSKFQMKYIKEDLKLPLTFFYGHSEYAVIAKYCMKEQKYFFYPTYGGVEFIPTNNDNIYQIIATSTNTIGTVFKRYDTKDLCVIEEKEESSKSNFISVDEIIGRVQEFYYDKDGTLNAFGPLLFGIHNEFWTYFDRIQFIQNKIGVLEVLILNLKNKKLYEVLNERFLNKTDLVFFNVSQIERTHSGKHRYFIQNLEVKDFI